MIDQLLEWMSFRRSGSVSDLPADLGNRAARDLATLGHLELMPNANWRVAPPVLASLPLETDSAAAVLCGARTPGVLAALSEASTCAGVQLDFLAQTAGPAVVRVAAGSRSELAAVASTAGVPLQHSAAFAILACTPAIRDWPRTPCAMVGGRVKEVERFSRSQIGWIASSLDEAAATRTGFFRIRRDWDRVDLLKTGVSDCAYIEHRAGRLAAAAKLKAVRWTAASGAFSLPGQLFPPILIARALTLCSGFLPQYDAGSRQISFAGVPPQIMRLALAITGLRLA